MKKKVIVIAASLMLIAILAVCLVACNPYKWDSIGKGENVAAESNGGYVVKQGKYLYYINGYAGTDADNSWGTPVKQSLVRAELDENGNVKAGTSKIVVPKLIFNATTDGGFAIFGDWIYYATTNDDKDKTGTASTTNMDFMRTKTDGSVTQLIGRLNDSSARSTRYIFTESKILYYSNSAINYIDFSGMKTNKFIKNGKGAKSGVLVSSVASVAWSYDTNKIFYSKTVSGDESYKHYNELHCINKDGTGDKILATQDTFIEQGEDVAAEHTKVFQYSVISIYPEQDGAVTVYYTKSFTRGSAVQDGLYCAKIADSTTSILDVEKQLNRTGGTSVTLYPLGYELGAIVSDSSRGNYLESGSDLDNWVLVTSTSQTIWGVRGDYVYFTNSSGALSKVTYKKAGVVQAVLDASETVLTSFMKIDFIGDKLYFFASSDDNYLHVIDVNAFDPTKKDDEGNLIKSEYIGFEREEEAE